MNYTAEPLAKETDSLEKVVERIGHLLPSQAPIRRFVHHNTLHSFEHLDFDQAVEEGGRLFDCQPYPTEEFFAAQLSSGRIQTADLEAVLGAVDDDPLSGLPWKRREFMLQRLKHCCPLPSAAEIRYLVVEGQALFEFHPSTSGTRMVSFVQGFERRSEALEELWKTLVSQVPPAALKEAESRTEARGELNGFLIRYLGAYIDQGVSYWPMPERRGLYQTFVELFSQPLGPSRPWRTGLSTELRRHREEEWNAEQALEDAAARLGIQDEELESELRKRALALRGWAGMLHQLELRPDTAPVQAPPVRLLDYLAIYLLLEVQLRPSPSTAPAVDPPAPDYSLAYEAFCFCQFMGLGPRRWTPLQLKRLLEELSAFGELDRRRCLLQAYERRYRQEILDALHHHVCAGEFRARSQPLFQAVFCIDDREESLRRHLEEIQPEVETFGYAGFYGVTMTYQGVSDPHAQPLCPPVQTPRHLIREVAVEGGQPPLKRGLGGLNQTWRASRNSLVRGGLVTALGGFLAGIPLVGRTLFPGLFRRFDEHLEQVQKPLTRLKIEREPQEPANHDELWEGFTIEEMAGIVAGALKTMGAGRLSPLFVVVGHGSASLNNPHEAAHDCGATGGGRGGPNARAFAAMANHPEVRRRLGIPAETWFVGAYHNTCDDSMEYYDLDLVPQSHRELLGRACQALFDACVLDAHERCRRFENVSLLATPEKAYRHVQARAATLAQPRPEYGHCTNSLCIVGRRARTRGIFLDRRAFLVSYDPKTDDEGQLLTQLLEAVGPVGAGINLEYYFSTVDRSGYGCDTKLPHNITGLLAIMDGHSSDLRTGLPWQMVELHEPMRLLNIVEATPELLTRVLDSRPGLKALVEKGWIQLVAWNPDGPDFWVYQRGQWQPHRPETQSIPAFESSVAYYRGNRDHLPPARIAKAFRGDN